MRKRWGKILAAFIIAALFILTGCTGSNDGIRQARAEFANTYSSSDTWVIYWYICGTDLETTYGAASADIEELLQVPLPSNIKILLQTGSTQRWHTEGIPGNGAAARFLYDENGLKKIASLGNPSMGDVQTLTDFLRFGKENYPADHRVFVFWDHGGGSAVGLCVDEMTQQILSLDDVRQAFTAVYPAHTESPPFELVGFDACLMATVDTAAALHGIARYMVGSEEVQSVVGWKYDSWVNALGENPAMGGDALGKVICDSFFQGCVEDDSEELATLSVTDLSRTPALMKAYGDFGAEALRAASQNQRQFFAAFSRSAGRAESYGGNTREQGYSNMVDLGDLVENARSQMPQTADALLAALRESVIYKVNGKYHANSSGLSCFYSYDGDPESWRSYANLSIAPLPIKCLYYHLLYGEMPPEAAPFLTGGYEYAPPRTERETVAPMSSAASAPTSATAQHLYNVAALENTPVDIDGEGSAFVRLSDSAMALLASVHCQFFYFSPQDDILLYLGSDANINGDWDTGLFKDNFFGQWPMLDGHPVYIEIIYESEDYNLYSIPIKLNGVACNLQVSYSFKDNAYHILGARRELEASGVADRNLVQLKYGDTITTLHYAMTITGDDTDYTQVEVDTFTVGRSPKVADEDVGDGQYGYYFEFVDPLNNSAWSDMVTYTIQGDAITTSIGTDMFENDMRSDTFSSSAGQTVNMPGAIADEITGGISPDGENGGSFDMVPAGNSIADQLTDGAHPGDEKTDDFNTVPTGGNIADQLTR